MQPNRPSDPTSSLRVDQIAAGGYPSQSGSYQWSIFLLSMGLIVSALILQRMPSGSSAGLQFAGVPLPELCLSQRLFGARCPGCGLTRSVVSTARGDLSVALIFHPAGPLIFGWALVQIPYRLVNLWRLRCGKLAWQTPGATIMAFLIVAICIVQWLVRWSFWF